MDLAFFLSFRSLKAPLIFSKGSTSISHFLSDIDVVFEVSREEISVNKELSSSLFSVS